jgi:hypothetical protein
MEFLIAQRVFGVWSPSTRSTIFRASVTASAIAATYAGEFLGAVASLLAARIEAHTAMIADFLGSSTESHYHFRFLFAIMI